MMPAYWQEASFRGVPFYVEAYDNQGGRRGPDHEFPHKDQGYPEDTGKTMETYSMEAYVVRSVRDSSYTARASALKAALNQAGPGELSHPIFGVVRVQVRSWSLGESKSSLGLIPFKLEFREASEPTYPSAFRSTAGGMSVIAWGSMESAISAFSRAFQVAGKSDFLRDSASANAISIGDMFARVASSFGLPLDISGLTALLVMAIQTAGDDSRPVAEAVAAFPRAIAEYYEKPYMSRRNDDGTYRGASKLPGGGPLPPAAGKALEAAMEFELTAAGIVPRTATRRRQCENAEALAWLVRTSSVVETARMTPFVNWETIQDAEDTRDRVVVALDRTSMETRDDVLFEAISEMRQLVFRTVPPEQNKLPALAEYTPPMTMPSLLASYKLYASALRADELATLNRIRHPGFFPGMEPLQVIVNVG